MSILLKMPQPSQGNTTLKGGKEDSGRSVMFDEASVLISVLRVHEMNWQIRRRRLGWLITRAICWKYEQWLCRLPFVAKMTKQ